jgi:cation-transporting ATPase 13A3/4/5
MLSFSKWTFQETDFSSKSGCLAQCFPPKKGFPKIDILRRFEFSSETKKMSVIVRKEGKLYAFLKGAPEVVFALCTSPPSAMISDALNGFAKNGFRVIGCAYKLLDSSVNIDLITREEVENRLIFKGAIIFENRLKQETTGVIQEMRDSNFRCIMATGDNLLTALHVARNCGILSENAPVYFANEIAEGNVLDCRLTLAHEFESLIDFSMHNITLEDFLNNEFIPPDYLLACSGQLFEFSRKVLDSARYKELIMRTFVFARLSPNSKKLLVEDLKEFGFSVLMCGDGTNDCGALKAADVGISLSEAEASVAAPFTSKVKNISCVKELISEGRAALVTSLSCFKYMAAYSFTEYCSVMLLYSIAGNLSDFQYLTIDLIIILPLSIFSKNLRFSRID